MSYTYLPEQGAESSADCFSDIPASVLSRLNLSADRCSCNVNGMVSCHDSQSGMMCAHLRENRGEGKSMSSQGDFPVKTSALGMPTEKESRENEVVCGSTNFESFAKWDHVLCLWKTPPCLHDEGFIEFSGTWPDWGMMLDGECFRMEPLEVRLSDDAYGLLPTPTVTDGTIHGALISKSSILKLDKNGIPRRYLYDGRSASLGLGRLYLLLTGELLPPEESESLMAWPTDWTALKPLEMDKFRSWLLQHGDFLMSDRMF